MAQVKIFGVAERLGPRRQELSRVIHGCVMDALGMPADKRAHRFIRLEPEDFVMPGGRTEDYTILEISLMSGRTAATKKRLVRLLFDRIEAELGIAPQDLEICLYENPPENWGFRGYHGDEVQLSYEVRR